MPLRRSDRLRKDPAYRVKRRLLNRSVKKPKIVSVKRKRVSKVKKGKTVQKRGRKRKQTATSNVIAIDSLLPNKRQRASVFSTNLSRHQFKICEFNNEKLANYTSKLIRGCQKDN